MSDKRKYDCIIVGQGISGILMAFELVKKGLRCALFDDGDPLSASNNAGALLNPVNLNTGKVFPHQQQDFNDAVRVYREIEKLLSVKFLEVFPLYFFSSDKVTEQLPEPLKPATQADVMQLQQYFHLPVSLFKINEVYHIRFADLKNAWRQYWQEKGNYFASFFDSNQCNFSSDKVCYKEIEANKIIFTEGTKGALNKLFYDLPFVKNKGNLLHLKIETLPESIYHFNGKKLLPLGNQIFWFGSNYQWDFDNPEPDKKWLQEMAILLKNKLKVPFKILDHFAAKRPTTAGQQPLLLRHEKFSSAYFFNGLGTRGFSIGPALAKKFTEQYF